MSARIFSAGSAVGLAVAALKAMVASLDAIVPLRWLRDGRTHHRSQGCPKHSAATIARRAVAATLVLAGLIAVAAGEAKADEVVSNLGQTDGGTTSLGQFDQKQAFDQAQAFTTKMSNTDNALNKFDKW